MVKFEPLVYNKTYVYPAWGTAIGFILAASSMILIPLYAVYRLIITPGTVSEVSRLLDVFLSEHCVLCT